MKPSRIAIIGAGPIGLEGAVRGAVRDRTAVLSIGREGFSKRDAIGNPERANSPFRILLRDARGTESVETADVVLDCSGTYQNHRWAGRGGIPAPGERAIES